jgi:hypothetical protein
MLDTAQSNDFARVGMETKEDFMPDKTNTNCCKPAKTINWKEVI